MTMFSMKPKFDLKEFLATPATKPTRRRNSPATRPAPEATDAGADVATPRDGKTSGKGGKQD